MQTHDAFGAAFDNDIQPVLPGVGTGGDGDGVAALEVAGLLLVGAGAEHEAVVDPHPDQRRDVRPAVAADRREPVQLRPRQRLAHRVAVERLVGVAEPLVERAFHGHVDTDLRTTD
jgi:hypothetical protein